MTPADYILATLSLVVFLYLGLSLFKPEWF